tara:strand:+ start:638 stop:1015 length:378 start_codon:yes stop_codon:yes gene_type:complete
MGKWFGAVSDVRKAQQNNKKPPLFKKLFQAGSVEEEALALLIHEKTIKEQEQELQTLLNWRYGFGTWKELIELRRKIKQEREDTIYKQQQRVDAFMDGVLIFGLIVVMGGAVVGVVYLLKLNGTI